jgi:hypothetical protein
MRTPIRLFAAACTLLLMCAPGAHASTLAPVAVFADGSADNFTGEDITPVGSMNDLTAGFIGETDDGLQFTWQVADYPDVPSANGVPLIATYYWDFSLRDPNVSGAAFDFQLNVSAPIVPGQHIPHTFDSASLGGNCTTTGNLITCTPIPGSVVTATFDTAANTITANVRRVDLKAPNGSDLAVDGATLDQAALFAGIAACPTLAGALVSIATCDTAVMDDTYVLGSPRE